MPRKKPKTFNGRRELRFRRWNGKVDLGDHPFERGKGKKILLVGKTGTGKSIMSRYLCYQNREALYGAIGMSNVPSSVLDFESYIPKLFVYPSLAEEPIRRYMAMMKELSADPHWELERWGIFVDDCSEKRGALNSNLFREVFMQSRHYNLFLIVALQYFVDVSIQVRQNCDWVVVGRETNGNVQKRLFDNFYSSIFNGDFSLFVRAMKSLTNNYSMAAFNNISSSTELEDTLFAVRARLDLPPFRVGHDDLWLISGMKVARSAAVNALDILAKIMPPAGSTNGGGEEKEDEEEEEEEGPEEEEGEEVGGQEATSTLMPVARGARMNAKGEVKDGGGSVVMHVLKVAGRHESSDDSSSSEDEGARERRKEERRRAKEAKRAKRRRRKMALSTSASSAYRLRRNVPLCSVEMSDTLSGFEDVA